MTHQHNNPRHSVAHPTNPLLVKNEVGHAPPTVYDLPAAGHVYGKLVERHAEESAANVLKVAKAKSTTGLQAPPALDYITMNRNTAKEGLIAPKDINQHRRQHPVHLKPASEATRTIEEKRSGPLPSDQNPGYVYGKPTRPSTPVSRLMTDQYQREWIDKQAKKKADEQKLLKQKQERKAAKAIQATLAFKGRNKPEPVATQELFKLKKFSHATTKLDTGRKATAVAPAKASVAAA